MNAETKSFADLLRGAKMPSQDNTDNETWLEYRRCRMEFIARCNPATMQKVWEALNGAILALAQQPVRPLYAAFHEELHRSVTQPAADKLHAALALLDSPHQRTEGGT